MKSTVPFLPVFWVKACSVILMLVCIGFTDVQAQNYKTLDDAVIAVQAAIADLESAPKPSTNSSLSVSGPGTGLRVSYFKDFVLLARSMKGSDVGVAVTQLDAKYPTSAPEPRKTALVQARAALMVLITL